MVHKVYTVHANSLSKKLNESVFSWRLRPGLSRLMLILSRNTQFLREILVFSFFIVLNADAWTMLYSRNLSGHYNSSWSAHFPMRFLSLTRLAHFYPFVSSDPFPTGIQFTPVPSVDLSISLTSVPFVRIQSSSSFKVDFELVADAFE